MADMEQLKDLLKLFTREQTTEEWDCGNPVGAPVKFNLRKLNQAHVDHNCKEAFHLTYCNWLPFSESRPWCEAILTSEMLDCPCCVPADSDHVGVW